MNWIYNGLPDTDREVLIAYRAPEVSGQNINYMTCRRSYHNKESWLVPNHYDVLAWADYPRLRKDGDGKAVSHHWLDVEGLKQ